MSYIAGELGSYTLAIHIYFPEYWLMGITPTYGGLEDNAVDRGCIQRVRVLHKSIT
jgi:hypothetical protein